MTVDLLEQHQSGLPDNVRQRCRHIVLENQRVLDATARLRHHTLAGFGGCTVHLAKKAAIPQLAERIQRLYPPRFNLEPAIYVLAQNLEAGPVVVSE